MNKFITKAKRNFTLDIVLAMFMLIFLTLSSTAIYLSAPLLSGGIETATGLVYKQIFWFGVGFFIIAFLIWFGVERLFTIAYVIYWILMVLLLGLALSNAGIINVSFITEINGTHAWYQIPGVGSLQPSEFMKICLAIITANIIHDHNQNKRETSWSSDFNLFFKIAKYALPPVLLILRQPDTGVPIVIIISLAFMFVISGVKREWAFIVGFGAIFALGSIVFLYYNFPEVLNSLLGGGSGNYRLTRFYGWLDYEKYPLNYGYQTIRAMISMGTSGLTGHPLSSSIMAFPEAQTDFIFAVITQNFGFIGATFTILLCFFFDFKLISNTIKSYDPRERYMMIGIVGMIAFQQVENIGMIFALLPITGITLPFVSYGGSSIASYMIPLAVSFHQYSEYQNQHKH